jgi:hypothetical protein
VPGATIRHISTCLEQLSQRRPIRLRQPRPTNLPPQNHHPVSQHQQFTGHGRITTREHPNQPNTWTVIQIHKPKTPQMITPNLGKPTSRRSACPAKF